MKRLLNSIFVFGLALLILPSDGSAEKREKTIPKNATIYVEEMEEDLDGYIRAEFMKQKVSLQLVLTVEDAELILTGSTTKEEKRKWHEGWLTEEKDRVAANAMVFTKKTKKLLWAGEAGDRSIFWGALSRGGHRKVASRLVKNLKKSIKKKK